MPERSIRTVLWWLCLFVAPLILLVIELFHPAGFTADPGMYQYLSQPQPYDPRFHALAYPGPEWWFALHMIQTPLVGLVAVGLWLLAGRIGESDGTAAVALGWLGRVATFVFLVYYTTLDSIGGSGLGRAILNTERMAADGQLSPDQLAGVVAVLNTNWVDPWVGGVGSFVSLTGSWAAFAAALLLALALGLAKRAPLPALILLVGFGWELQMSHTMPHGPIAFGLLLVAAAWIRFADRRGDAGAGAAAA
jgi:hypothetical protein